MRPQLVAALWASLLWCGPVSAHALFPAKLTVTTFTDQAWVNLEALNARHDVTHFQVEVFEGRGWAPSRAAVATPEQVTVPASHGDTPAVRPIRVLIDLRGQRQREVLVCTKSVHDGLELNKLVIGTRVCSRIKVVRFGG